MNGVDINRFQFEYDLTWMAFFQNEEGRTYARYGGREDEFAESHLSKASLLRVMRQVLELHRDGAARKVSRYEPLGKRVRTPEDIPPMEEMIARRKENTCIHCHDVKVAGLKDIRARGKLTKDLVFTYPSPQRLGLRIDRDRQDTIKSVVKGSAAALAGLESGDVIQSVDDQPVLTFADFTRVLEFAPDRGKLPITVERGPKTVSTTIGLSGNWRRNVDASWRASVEAVGPNGGFWGRTANASKRRQLGLGKDDLAVEVTFIWGAWTRKAGIKIGDTVVAVDGQTDDMNVRQIHAHLQLERNFGDAIDLEVLRGKRRVKLRMTLPDRLND